MTSASVYYRPPRLHPSALPNRKGLALFPLILSFALLGILIGAGVSLVKPRIQKEKRVRTLTVIRSAVDAISSYAVEHGTLPVWDDNTADGSTDEFIEITKTSRDSWNQPIVYIFDGNLTSSATGGVCGRKTTGITAGAASDVAFVVLSGGDDYDVGSLPSVSGPFSGNLVASQDDLVHQVGLTELQQKAGCFAGTTGRLTVLNNELPRACAGELYTATLFAQGGVPSASSPHYIWTQTVPAWISSATPSDDRIIFQGTPATPGTATIDVSVTDLDGNQVDRSFQLQTEACSTGPTPVSNWDFNEGGGTLVNDAVGGNNGTLVGDTAWSGGTPDGSGSALAFDGSGDSVVVADNVSLHITDELTLMAWALETNSRAYAKVISRRLGSYFYFLGVDNGRPYGGVGDGIDYDVTGKSLLMSLDRWNHLSFIYKDPDDRMHMHFAGTERWTQVVQNLPPTVGIDVCIGGDSGGSGNFFNGDIDDLAIYRRALNDPEIRALYLTQTHPDLVASYVFQGDLQDGSGSGHNGSPSGVVYVEDRFGNPGGALRFDGNDYVLLSDHPDFQLTTGLTVTAWIKEAVPGQYAKLLSRRSGNYFYFLGVDNGRPYGGIGDGSSYTVTRKTIDMPADTWHFVAFVYDGLLDTMTIYYDGILDETITTISLPVVMNVDLSIGADNEGGSNFFQGRIDDPAVYDTALSAEEIRAVYD